MPLSAKQARFVAEYLVDLNATQAAIRAGYSEKTAAQVGFENLRKPEVARAIAEAQAARAARTQVDGDQVLRELAQIAFFDPADLSGVKSPDDVAALPPEVRRAIVGWSWDKHGNFVVKLAPKMTGLELIGRHLSLWNDKLKHDVDDQLAALLENVSNTTRGLPVRGGGDE